MHVLERIYQYVVQTPNTLAFQSGERTITYAQLWQQSEALAGRLTTLQQGPVIVYGHMEPEMLVGFLAAIKSGRPYIPVDVSIPLERVERIIELAQPVALIQASDITLQVDVPILQCTGETRQSNDYLQTCVRGDDNFYIIFTSGSTGQPKGVQISERNLATFIEWMTSDFPLTNGVYLNQAPFSFDLSVMDIYPALSLGGTIRAVTKELVAAPKRLFAELQRSEVSVWTSTPSFVQMCLMDPSFNEQLLPQLRVFLFCGEVLPSAIAEQLLERFPKARVFNTYGPTEATVAVTQIEITKDTIASYSSLPVGVAKRGVTIQIMANDEIVPHGEKGEIVIVGDSVSKGYLAAPQLTEKAFMTIDGQRAYRTGDAGIIEDGLLFCKGRLDFQIKLHGYRMELEEIEFHLGQCDYVQQAAVVPIGRDDHIDYLLAVVIASEHSFAKEFQLTSAIKQQLSERLPSYMVPRKFTYVTQLPMTANGKLDRNQVKSEVGQ